VKTVLPALMPAPAPGGDAMTVRFHRDAEADRLKSESARRPLTWAIHPDDVARFAAEGKHCETRHCRNPVAVVTWRFWRSASAGRVLLSEHLVCAGHGRAFAARHHLAPPALHGSGGER